jgi:predicted metal-dependent phosphoesterase TrpH
MTTEVLMEAYKYDTHVHTSQTSSCSRVKGKEIIRLYKKAGYRGLVITDHYCSEYFEYLRETSWYGKIDRFLEGYRDALKEGRRTGMDVLLGIEIRLMENSNDYLIFGLEESFLFEKVELYRLSLKEFRKMADDNELLIFQAHPFRIGIKPADPDLLDGVEIYNGNPRQISRNHLAFAFAFENNLEMLSGSDFHQKQDLARGGIILPETVNSSRDFVKFIKNGKPYDIIKTD